MKLSKNLHFPEDKRETYLTKLIDNMNKKCSTRKMTKQERIKYGLDPKPVE